MTLNYEKAKEQAKAALLVAPEKSSEQVLEELLNQIKDNAKKFGLDPDTDPVVGDHLRTTFSAMLEVATELGRPLSC